MDHVLSDLSALTQLSWVALHDALPICLENPMNSMKRQKDTTLKDELPRSVGTQYATGDQWRNSSRRNEEAEVKQKQHPVVDILMMEVKSDSVKKNTAQEPGMLGP